MRSLESVRCAALSFSYRTRVSIVLARAATLTLHIYLKRNYCLCERGEQARSIDDALKKNVAYNKYIKYMYINRK